MIDKKIGSYISFARIFHKKKNLVSLMLKQYLNLQAPVNLNSSTNTECPSVRPPVMLQFNATFKMYL